MITGTRKDNAKIGGDLLGLMYLCLPRCPTTMLSLSPAQVFPLLSPSRAQVEHRLLPKEPTLHVSDYPTLPQPPSRSTPTPPSSISRTLLRTGVRSTHPGAPSRTPCAHVLPPILRITSAAWPPRKKLMLRPFLTETARRPAGISLGLQGLHLERTRNPMESPAQPKGITRAPK